MNKNKMTLLLTTFDRLQYLKKTLPKFIRSAIINNCFLLIIDNGSTDGTTEYLKKIKKNYNFITYYKRQKNIGATKSYKYGITKIKTKYFMVLNDHNCLYGNYIKKTISILDNFKNVSIVHHYFANNHNKKIDFYKKGVDAKKIIFQLSGAATGLTFRNEKNLSSKYIVTNNKIYSQIDLCMYLANKADIALLNNAGFLYSSSFHPKEIGQLNFDRKKTYKNYINNFNKNPLWEGRPIDFGLNERVQIAKKNFNIFSLLEACAGLFNWHMNFFNTITDLQIKNKYHREILKIFNIYCIHKSFIINFKNFHFKNFTFSIFYLLNFKTLLCLFINTILFFKNFFINTIIFFKKYKNKISMKINNYRQK